MVKESGLAIHLGGDEKLKKEVRERTKYKYISFSQVSVKQSRNAIPKPRGGQVTFLK